MEKKSWPFYMKVDDFVFRDYLIFFWVAGAKDKCFVLDDFHAFSVYLLSDLFADLLRIRRLPFADVPPERMGLM